MCKACDRRQSLEDAFRTANINAPAVVVWSQRLGWYAIAIKDYKEGDPTPEILCLGLGKHPLPLNETGKEAWFSMIADKAHKLNL